MRTLRESFVPGARQKLTLTSERAYVFEWLGGNRASHHNTRSFLVLALDLTEQGYAEYVKGNQPWPK